MLKNERQYRITKTQIQQFEQALAQMKAAPAQPGVHPLLQSAQEDGLRGQLDDLRRQLADYESLAAGGQKTFRADSLDALPVPTGRPRTA